MQSKNKVFDEASQWLAEDLEHISNCPVCNSTVRLLLHDGLTDNVAFSAPGKWTMYRCQSCASSYLEPRPTPESIGLAYKDYFTHGDLPEYSTLGFYRKIKHRLANGYRNFRYGTHETPACYLGVMAAALLPDARARADSNMRNLPRAKKGSRLLDLGCGNGEFLLSARSAGWNVVGVDFDEKAVKIGRQKGLDVYLGGVDVIDSSVEKFDVITLSHVIEHVHEPVELLKSCFCLLKPDGFLWLETPNIDSEGHGIFGRDWRGLEPPRHLVLFTQESMRYALKLAGFSEVRVQSYSPQCNSTFGASQAIADGADPYLSLYQNGSPVMVNRAERIAKKHPSRREFITVKAWK